MPGLSAPGQKAVDDLAQRHGFSPGAVNTMLAALQSGGGRMAQFDHPEFGGHGQWMSGGMIMISDMFNSALKARVAALCDDLARLIADQGESLRAQSGGGSPTHSSQGAAKDWWPADLGTPNSSGAQNSTRYAYFAKARRLAIEANGRVTVYDTEDHQIGGVSQQQSGASSLVFTSQHGPVELDKLPVVKG